MPGLRTHYDLTLYQDNTRHRSAIFNKIFLYEKDENPDGAQIIPP